MRELSGARSGSGCTPGEHLEDEIDDYVDRAVRIDPDVWVVEIEDANGRRFLTEPVEGD